MKVDPFLIPLPHALARDTETRAWFQYLQRWLHDMWLRTGGGDDSISALESSTVADTQTTAQINDLRVEIEALQRETADTRILALLSNLEDRVASLEVQNGD